MNSPISIFKNFNSPPVAFTLLDWLRICKRGDSRFKSVIEQYRQTSDSEFKKSLPLATVGALFTGEKDCEKYPDPGKGYRVIEQIESLTGWISLDIDAKDNPGMDAEQVRDELANFQNVAFSGLSASGKGVWCLVKVKHPDRQSDHFEMLLQDFAQFGITLDSSKGRNPNDARFYSYDPEAVIKNDFKIYKKLPPPRKKPEPATVKLANASKYAEAAFKDELQILVQAQNGNRNNQLFKSAASLAGLVAGGMLNEYEVRTALEETAETIGLKSHEIKGTLRSGFDAGFASPRTCDSNDTKSGISSHYQNGDKPVEAKYESDEINKDPIFKEIVETFDCEPIEKQ